jgi:type IV secretion system protein VirD4
MNKRNTLVGPQLQRGRAGFTPDWKRLIAFVAVIVLGSIVATQVLANSYQFHPALGFNVFHVYPPWSYFLWSHQWNSRAIIRFLPKLSGLDPWSHSADLCFC